MKQALLAWSDWWTGWLPTGGISRLLRWPCIGRPWATRRVPLHHLIVGLLVLWLSYGGDVAERLFRFLLPLILTGIVYDLQRYYPTSLRGRIHVAAPYQLEKKLFGIQTAAGIVTPNEWWQLHLHPSLDLVTGFCYLVFIPQFVLTAAYFTFVVGRRGSERRSADSARRAAPRVMWALLWLNVLGYVTHNIYPSAPPWYAARFGLGAVHPNVPADPAGTIRFDHMLGTHYFSSFYGRSVDAFGAVPSLHVAFSALALYYAVRFGAARTVSALFLLVMCFSAIYLDHHYVIDLVSGMAYALIVGLGTDLFCEWRYRTARLWTDDSRRIQ